MTQSIQEVFKQFCKERHAEDKGRNFDKLQEIYASTEFFDTTLYEVIGVSLQNFTNKDKAYMADFPVREFCMPFQNVFIRVADNHFLYLREYEPNIITGTLYTVNYLGEGNKLNVPFTIRITPFYSVILSDFYVPLLKEKTERIIRDMFIIAIGNCMTLNELSKKSIVADKPSNPTLYEYYRRKRASTIKVPQRPIYYILGEKNENVSKNYSKIRATGNLEYSYCFSVRGHWRKIDDKHYGKDRNGNYNVAGYTWVNEYTKGEGELAKRIRVIE